MSEKPKVTIELQPGTYLVQISSHPVPRARVWTHDGDSAFIGHGGKIQRAGILNAFSRLIASAERHEAGKPRTPDSN